MGERTAIAWTDHTFNPWWGCARVSPGCQHCYAEAFAKRTGNAVWGKESPRRFFGDKHWAEPLKWNAAAERAGEPARVFCASMADVFEDRTDLDEQRHRLWGLIMQTPHLTWQLLTKRPENVRTFFPRGWWDEWPSNVWIGTTVEDQQRADERLPHLADIPATVRFLSCEPLLGCVDLGDALPRGYRTPTDYGTGWEYSVESGCVDWVICGGESGAGHRPLDLDNARFLRNQCAKAGVPFFFKQIGGRTPTAGGDMLDGVRYKEFPKVATDAPV
jgi:protein gp37